MASTVLTLCLQEAKQAPGLRDDDERVLCVFSKMLLWPPFWSDFQYRRETRETGKYYSGAGKQGSWSSVLEVSFSEKSCATTLRGKSQLVNGLARAHPWPPEGLQGSQTLRFKANFGKINKIDIQKLIRRGIRLSIYQLISFAARTKRHASRKLEISTYPSVK